MSIQPYPGNTNWPAEWQGSRLTGKFVNSLGEPLTGTVTFTPSTAAVIAGVSKIIVVGKPVTVTLDAAGSFDVILPATDDPDSNPVGWTYAVSENFSGGRKYDIDAPMNATRDLSAIVPVPSSNGVAIVKGDKGDPGPAGPAGTAGTVRFRATGPSGQNLAQNSFTTVPMNAVDYNVGGGAFDAVNYTWTVPVAGLYLCTGALRITDSAPARSTFIGIHTSNVDGPWGTWQNMGGITRDMRKYLRLAQFNVGDVLRLYLYSDGQTFPMDGAELTATLIIAT